MSDIIQVRRELSKKYILGKGLEIGALQNPLPISEKAQVIYIDKIDVPTAYNIHYQELKGQKLANVDVLDDGEKLNVIPPGSQDFIIANHFLEHTQNPIKSIEVHLSRLKLGGILFYAVPNKNKTFDLNRPLTTFEHILQDYKNGPESSYDNHVQEWVELVDKIVEPSLQKQRIEQIKKINYSIHFHVWDEDTFFDFLEKTNKLLNYPYIIEEHVKNVENESIAILCKSKTELERLQDYSILDKRQLAIKILLEIYNERKDLQDAFPEAAKGEDLSRLLGWTKQYGIHCDPRLFRFF
ncbi:MAG: class I SAM-dependent methyltransferase [Nitrosotalea sp.]